MTILVTFTLLHVVRQRSRDWDPPMRRLALSGSPNRRLDSRRVILLGLNVVCLACTMGVCMAAGSRAFCTSVASNAAPTISFAILMVVRTTMVVGSLSLLNSTPRTTSSTVLNAVTLQVGLPVDEADGTPIKDEMIDNLDCSRHRQFLSRCSGEPLKEGEDVSGYTQCPSGKGTHWEPH